MKKVAALPALLTLGNMLCGFHAIYFASKGTQDGLMLAAWMVFAAMVFDALDGKVARLTRVSSDFGAELDSLADVVSFGIAPAFLVALLSAQAQLQHQRLVWLSCMVYAVCAALRLARFNVQTTTDEESHESFSGLPSPVAAGQVVSLLVLHHHLKTHFGITVIPRLLPTVTFFTGVLMVSRIRYRHLVNRLLSGHHAFAEVAFLAIVVLLLATHKEFTLAGGFTLYVVAGILGAVREAVFRRAEEEKPIF
jgi:CDP-diacylglycerol--serine O-phosphatidyltransferase